MKNKIIIAIVAIILIGGSYYVGSVSAGKSGQSTFPGQGNMQGSGKTAGSQARGMNRNNLNFISGEVISKDATSLTIKLRDGSTKNIFYSDNTKISKQAEGVMDDIAVGTNVMVNGDTNQDGSVSAKDVQIRPVMNVSSTTPPDLKPETVPATN